MAKTVVKIELNPVQFDTLRDALLVALGVYSAAAIDREKPAWERSEPRQKAERLKKLRSEL